MKRLRVLTLVILLLLILTACGGNVDNVNVIHVDSQIYTQAEINAAIDVVLSYFRANFDGCTLTQLCYAGDEAEDAFDQWANQYNSDQAIILVSSFDVGSSGGDGSLNPNSTYTEWQWILVRDEGGNWRHATHGYG